jgi:sugar phosphate isomerase/epimerase
MNHPMRFGICVPVEDSARVKAIGFDYVEEVVPRLLQGEVENELWTGEARAKAAALAVPAGNALVPGNLRITGPDVVPEKLRAYIERIIDRAARVGIKTLVFGSGAARMVPDGFDRKEARRQILDFIRMAMPYCARRGIVMVCEPLNRGECNIINSIPEAMEYVWQVDHPHFQCLLDVYHFWLENEPLEHLRDAMPWIRHTHLADTEGRRPPGLTGKNDYRPLFAELKRAAYDGSMSIETIGYAPLLEEAPRSLQFLKSQWNE